MKPRHYLYFLFLILILFTSCEDVITDDISLDQGTVQLAVDAWLNDQSETQEITLTLTQPYFENTLPPAAIGATVQVRDETTGNTFNFTDANNEGVYTWQPSTAGEVLCMEGNSYTLTITYEGETYQATSTVNRVPSIDSIAYEFRDDEFGAPDGYYAELFARDLEGPGDTYWIRTFKNSEFLNEPVDINVAYDAGFSQGGNVDGLIFITPIREAINPFTEGPDDDPPYEIGDRIDVEIYSITNEAFFFFESLQIQLNNAGLFAEPSANVPSNIQNSNPNSTKKAVGYFGTGAASRASVTVQ